MARAQGVAHRPGATRVARDIRLISSQEPRIIVSTGKERILVRLVRVSCREESLFVGALREVFDSLRSPRYLLVTKDEELAVPRALAERKEVAESLARRCRRLVGGARLLYAHGSDGKRRLLRVQERFLVSKYHPRTEFRLRWG